MFREIDLRKIGMLDRAFKSRWFQPALLWINLVAFIIFIFSGFFGTPIGNRNSAIVVIWILWFFVLAAFMIPLGGRIWCMFCPIPAPAEWLQRRSFVSVNSKSLNLGIEWPSRLDNIWLQNFGFLAIASFSPIIFYYPAATAIVLLIFIAVAIVVGLVFTNRGKVGRIFCRFLCPLGGFIALYSLTGALDVRHRDANICKNCKLKTCIKGNEKGYGCPWFLYPGGKKRNAYCNLCTECIKACAYDNQTMKIRRFGEDILKERHLDEAFKSHILLGSSFVYSTAYFAWFQGVKDVSVAIKGTLIADPLNVRGIVLFALILLSATLVFAPAIFLLFASLSKKLAKTEKSVKEIFVDYSYALIPLGLAGWIGFMIYMIMINGSYIVSIISDPFGWGWNLFGTADYKWRPYFTSLVPYAVFTAVMAGVIFATILGWKISLENSKTKSRALKAMIPIALFYSLVAGGFAYLYVMP